MPDYTSIYTGAQIDEAVGKALNMVDSVVEEHLDTTVGNWSYMKYASGVCVLWGQKTVDLGSVHKNTYNTNGFYTDSIEVPLPFNPGEAESTVVLGMAQNLCSVVNAFTGLSSGNPVMGFRLKREVDMSQVTPVRFLIIGRWQ